MELVEYLVELLTLSRVCGLKISRYPMSFFVLALVTLHPYYTQMVLPVVLATHYPSPSIVACILLCEGPTQDRRDSSSFNFLFHTRNQKVQHPYTLSTEYSQNETHYHTYHTTQPYSLKAPLPVNIPLTSPSSYLPSYSASALQQLQYRPLRPFLINHIQFDSITRVDLTNPNLTYTKFT